MFRGQWQADMMLATATNGAPPNSEAILLPPGDVENSDWPREHRAFYKVAYDVRGGNVDLLD